MKEARAASLRNRAARARSSLERDRSGSDNKGGGPWRFTRQTWTSSLPSQGREGGSVHSVKGKRVMETG